MNNAFLTLPLNDAELTRIAARLDNGGEISRWEANRLLATLRQEQARKIREADRSRTLASYVRYFLHDQRPCPSHELTRRSAAKRIEGEKFGFPATCTSDDYTLVHHECKGCGAEYSLTVTNDLEDDGHCYDCSMSLLANARS